MCKNIQILLPLKSINGSFYNNTNIRKITAKKYLINNVVTCNVMNSYKFILNMLLIKHLSNL